MAERDMDAFGWFVIIAVFTFTIAAYLTMIAYLNASARSDDVIRSCIASIPSSLDADEIRYQEQECFQGVGP